MAAKAGQTCIQCKKGMLKDTGKDRHGDRILRCDSCGWEVRENT